jgi:hypothetical protein
LGPVKDGQHQNVSGHQSINFCLREKKKKDGITTRADKEKEKSSL